MSGLGVQDALAALVVLGALAYLVRRRLRARSTGACAACEGCASGPDVPAAPDARAAAGLITIERPTRGPGPGQG